MIIYGIINKLNSKIYVGLSVKDDINSPQSRPYQHLQGTGRSSSKLVFQAVQKYGIENFLVIILHRSDCTREELKELEKWYILQFNTIAPNGYNLTAGGDGFTGKHMEASKKKTSISNKIAQNMPETKKKKSESEKIAQNKPEHKKKLSEIRNNKSDKEKEITRKKQSDSNKIAWDRPETKKKHFDAWNNKSEDKKEKTGKKLSVIGKIVQNRPEVKEKTDRGRHTRWHWNRGIINVDCEHCIAQVMKEHS